MFLYYIIKKRRYLPFSSLSHSLHVTRLIVYFSMYRAKYTEPSTAVSFKVVTKNS